MDFLLLTILSLANWRLAHFLAKEGGPWDFAEKLRLLVGVKHDDYGNPYGSNELAGAIICTWCNSFWIGIFQGVVALVAPEVALWLFLPLALSAVAVIIDTEV